MGTKKIALALAAVGVLVSGAAQAALFDRGGGLLYDDVLNVTWLQDANYAKTSGYDADGKMNWSAANTWAENLEYGGYADWRLAANTPTGVNWNFNYSVAGTTDVGFNITSPHSEMSYMYYVNLGLKGYFSPQGIFQPDNGVKRDGTLGQADVGLVHNLQSDIYWSGTDMVIPFSWQFSPGMGYQGFAMNPRETEMFAWAVRSGDVAAVPEPESYGMLLAGLGLIGVAARRRRHLGAL